MNDLACDATEAAWLLHGQVVGAAGGAWDTVRQQFGRPVADAPLKIPKVVFINCRTSGPWRKRIDHLGCHEPEVAEVGSWPHVGRHEWLD